MKILDRYTLGTFLAPLLWCLTIFIGLYLIIDLLGHLDEILKNKVPVQILAIYYGTMTPLVFVQVAPFACLMATLYALGNLNRHQELMAMRASGVSPWAITKPVIAMGLLLSAAVFLVNELAAPQAALITSSIKEQRLESKPEPGRPHKILTTIQHLAVYGQEQSLLYAKTFDPVERKMGGIVILQHGSDLRLKRKITAESAEWTGTRWRFVNGTILQFNAEGETVGRPVPFNAKFIQAGDRPEVMARSESEGTYMNMRDLRNYIRKLTIAGPTTLRKLWVDLYAKPAAALGCLVMTIIGIPFAIQPIRGAGPALGLSLGLGVGLAFYAINAFAIALGKGGLLPPILSASVTHLAFLFFGVRMTWRKLA
ncbi:MAG: LptF/LptG family permease [Candidatus Omnitrophica bacterium]|nr:LptF/LptG family permease [Candidatus Omnitrophota bacterium]